MRVIGQGAEGDLNAKFYQNEEHQSCKTVQVVKEITGIQI